MTNWVKIILQKYGQTITVRGQAGEVETKAFLQPVRERKEQLPTAYTPLGWLDKRIWMYLGQTEVSAGDVLIWNETKYCVRSSRSYWLGDETLYWWATLEQMQEAAE